MATSLLTEKLGGLPEFTELPPHQETSAATKKYALPKKIHSNPIQRNVFCVKNYDKARPPRFEKRRTVIIRPTPSRARQVRQAKHRYPYVERRDTTVQRRVAGVARVGKRRMQHYKERAEMKWETHTAFYGRHLRALLLCGGALSNAIASEIALADAFVPRSDEEVIERLPRAEVSIGKELRDLRKESISLEIAIGFARKFIKLAKEQSDPRYYGYAEGVLADWWNSPGPPADLLVLRATIKQNRHDFEGALRDLERALAEQPVNMQAWLTRAAILKLRARYDDARQSCMPLAQSKNLLLAITCLCEVNSLAGRAPESFDLLARYFKDEAGASEEQRQWSSTVLAEVAARLDKSAQAEAYFKDALSLPNPSAYLLATFADFLLDEGRPEEAAALLADKTRIDALLLRLALARRRSNAEDLSVLTAQIQERFAVSRMRGENFHLGDEARFTLYLLKRPHEALSLAKNNWAMQRTPQDARILLEASIAADDTEAVNPAVEFLSLAGMSRARLLALITEARALGDNK
jgi:hypothetical protein